MVLLMNSAMHFPLSAKLDAELRRVLTIDERILWQAMPDHRRLRLAYAIWIFAIPWTLFSLAWTGFALSIYLTTFESKTDNAAWWAWIGPLWGTPFIAVGLWMMYQPFKITAEARYTVHALTTKRLVTLTIRKDRFVKTVSLDCLGPISCTEKADGWGTISIETGSHKDSEGDKVTDKFEITGVPEVAKLHRLLLETQQAR